MDQLHSLSQSLPPELSLCPSLAVLLFSSPSLLPVSGSWQLVSITVISWALGCVRLMVKQQVKTAAVSFNEQMLFNIGLQQILCSLHVFVLNSSGTAQEKMLEQLFRNLTKPFTHRDLEIHKNHSGYSYWSVVHKKEHCSISYEDKIRGSTRILVLITVAPLAGICRVSQK